MPGEEQERESRVLDALRLFQQRVDAGQVPPRRRYSRIGGLVGSQRHQREKRNQQRRNAGYWRWGRR